MLSIPVAENQWLVDLYEEQGTTIHRLVVLLGAEAGSGHIVRNSFMGLAKRSNRIIDPLDRIEFLTEQVVHHARSVRGQGKLALPQVSDADQQQLLKVLGEMPTRLAEILVVSHYLSLFGPELAAVLRMTVRGCNARMEQALEWLKNTIGESRQGAESGELASISQDLTAALRAAAREVQPPGTATLADELQHYSVTHRAGASFMVVAPLMAIALMLGWALGSITSPQTPVAQEPTVVETKQPSAVSSPSLAGQAQSVPVYYIGREDGLLYQEMRSLPASGDLVKAALNAVLLLAPLDPDYTSTWDGGRVLEVELADDGEQLVVNLSEEAYAAVSSEDAQKAIWQIVYTATEILGEEEIGVSFLADGNPPPDDFAWQLFKRSGLDPMPLLWVTFPLNKEQLAEGKIEISGRVRPEGTPPTVTVLDQDGQVVASMTAQTAQRPGLDGWALWSAWVDLDAGEYTLMVASTVKLDENPVSSYSENRVILVG